MEAPLGPSHRQAHRAAMTCWWLWPGLGAYAWRCCPQYPLLPVVHAGQCCHGRARWLECHLASPAVRHVCQALQLHLLGMAPAGHLGCLVGLGLGCPPASTARSTAVLLRASHVTALACDSRQPDGSHYPHTSSYFEIWKGPLSAQTDTASARLRKTASVTAFISTSSTHLAARQLALGTHSANGGGCRRHGQEA